MEKTTSFLFPEGIDISKVGKYDKFINFQKIITYDHENNPIDIGYNIPDACTRFNSSTLESENLSVPETQYALKKMIAYLDAVIEKEVDEKMKYFRLRFLERVRRKYSYDFLKNGIKLKNEEPSLSSLILPTLDS